LAIQVATGLGEAGSLEWLPPFRPFVASHPANKVNTVSQALLAQIARCELGLHGAFHIDVIAELHLDDDRCYGTVWQIRLHEQVGLFGSEELRFAVDENAGRFRHETAREIVLEVMFEDIAQFAFTVRGACLLIPQVVQRKLPLPSFLETSER
jgi:hypothetical protein